MAADEGERKLAAVLAADVAGYSRLMADDDRATIRTLTDYREVFSEKVAAHKGRIVDTAGDSVLAIFDSVVEAVQAAVEIQRILSGRNEVLPDHRQMHFRVGINLGDIIIRDDGTAYGDGVNVAARLEGLAAAGGVMISHTVYDHVEGRLEVGLVDAGEHKVKNIAKPVKAYRVLLDGSRPSLSTTHSRTDFRRPTLIAGLMGALVIVATAGGWWWFVGDKQSNSGDWPSLVVQPFESLSDDPDLASVAHALTTEVSNGLSLFPDLRVIPAGTNQSDTDYVLRGNLQRGGEILRVSIELLNTASGEKAWGRSYEVNEQEKNVLVAQSEIAGQIVSTVADPYGAITTVAMEVMPAVTDKPVSGHRCIMLAKFFFAYGGTDAEAHERVRQCLETNTVQRPNGSESWAWLAMTYFDEATYTYPSKPDFDPLEGIFVTARKSLELSPHHQVGLLALGLAHYLAREYDQAHTMLEMSIARNQNNSFVLALGGVALANVGDWDAALLAVDRARLLNDKAPVWLLYPHVWNHFLRDEHEEAARYAEEVVAGWDHPFAHAAVATIYAHLGRMREARASVKRIQSLNPGFAAEAEEIYEFWYPSDGPLSGLTKRIMAGLEKAGLFDDPDFDARPVIAVLPFDNMSGDPEQEYFADGITEDIITRLAQFPNILVLGRNTTFQFKGQAVDIPTIAEKLKADYIVEGSIRRGGDTVRVTAQLLEGDGGTHLWAETFDRALDPENLFAMQDEITVKIASRIGDPYGEVNRAEYRGSNSKPPKYLSSYDCILRYFEYMRTTTSEHHKIARDCLESVLEVEPTYGEALAYLGDLYLDEVGLGYNLTTENAIEKALQYSKQAMSVDATNGQIRVRFARALYMNDNTQRARMEAEESLRLAPNNADIMSVAADVFAGIGAYERTAEVFKRVEILNPNYPTWLNWKIAHSLFAWDQYADAVIRLEMTQMDWWYWTHAAIASAHCANENIGLGQKALQTALELNPEFSDVYWPELYFWHRGPDVRPWLDNLSAGLEACGWDVPPDPGPEAFANAQ